MKTALKTSMCVAILLLVALVGCSYVKLTPAQQTLWAANVYLAQYDLYLEQVINPSISAEAKKQLKENPALIVGDYINPNLSRKEWEILKVKKQILIELKPVIELAIEYQARGETIDYEMQRKLTTLINRLITIKEVL